MRRGRTPPLLVGLDVTHEATLSDAEWEVDRHATPAVPYFARAGEDAEQDQADGFSPWQGVLDVDVKWFRAEVRRRFGF